MSVSAAMPKLASVASWSKRMDPLYRMASARGLTVSCRPCSKSATVLCNCSRPSWMVVCASELNGSWAGGWEPLEVLVGSDGLGWA